MPRAHCSNNNAYFLRIFFYFSYFLYLIFLHNLFLNAKVIFSHLNSCGLSLHFKPLAEKNAKQTFCFGKPYSSERICLAQILRNATHLVSLSL